MGSNTFGLDRQQEIIDYIHHKKFNIHLTSCHQTKFHICFFLLFTFQSVAICLLFVEVYMLSAHSLHFSLT